MYKQWLFISCTTHFTNVSLHGTKVEPTWSYPTKKKCSSTKGLKKLDVMRWYMWDVDSGQLNVGGTPHQPVDEIRTNHWDLNHSVFFFRNIFWSLKSSISLSLWQGFSTLGWSLTSRWGMRVSALSPMFDIKHCCQPEINGMFSSSCVGPGQHPARGRGFQH